MTTNETSSQTTEPISKRILIIDTSLIGFSIGLYDVEIQGGTFRCIHEKVVHVAETQSTLAKFPESLMSCFDRSLDVELDAVDLICCSTGPGSFTGIKIGLSFLSGLVAERKIPILGYSSLQAATEILLRENSGMPVCVLWPNTRTHAFFACSHIEDFHLHSRVKLIRLEVDPVAEWDLPRPMTENPDKVRFFFASFTGKFADTIRDYIGNKAGINYSDLDFNPLNVKEISEAALNGMLHECVAFVVDDNVEKCDFKVPKPRYLRLSTAEEQALARQEKNNLEQRSLVPSTEIISVRKTGVELTKCSK